MRWSEILVARTLLSLARIPGSEEDKLVPSHAVRVTVSCNVIWW